MGLDTVEIVMRTEEVFLLDLPDEECERVRTVGDLYRLVLLKIAPATTLADMASALKSKGRSRLNDLYPAAIPWTPEDIWATLVALIQDQLQVDIDEITEHATFVDDLGCD